MTLAEYDELIPPRVVDPVKRRRLLIGALVLALVASAVSAGVWWHHTAGDRAVRAYRHGLPAAEAAWPAAEARILALPTPAGWTADPTLTPCGMFGRGVTCWRTNTPDVHVALAQAVALLTSHGATVGDHLLGLELRAYGGGSVDQLRCTSATTLPSNSLASCDEYLTWDGASVEVRVTPGLAEYGVPASVLIRRGLAYPEGNVTTILSHVGVGEDVAALRRLTGLPASAFTLASCQGSTPCTRWSTTIAAPGAPDATTRAYVRALTEHGFRIERARDLGGQSFSVTALRNRAVGGGDPVLVSLHPQADGHGGTTGTLSVAALETPSP
jgi:hypothetical protein